VAKVSVVLCPGDPLPEGRFVAGRTWPDCAAEISLTYEEPEILGERVKGMDGGDLIDLLAVFTADASVVKDELMARALRAYGPPPGERAE
jgi:hypothetical protein